MKFFQNNTDYILPDEIQQNHIDIFFTGEIEKSITNASIWFNKEIKINSSKNKSTNIYCVGDVVSNAFLNHPILSEYARGFIIDNKTRGKKKLNTPAVQYKDYKVIEFSNHGKDLITNEAIKQILKVINEKIRFLIVVDGEEDLMIVPLILFAPLEKSVQSYVVYGQGKSDNKYSPLYALENGMFIVKITEQRKKEVAKVLERFETRFKE